MKFKEFINKEGYHNCDFMDSGIVDLFVDLHDKFTTVPMTECTECGYKGMFFIEPGNMVSCSECNNIFDAPKSPDRQ